MGSRALGRQHRPKLNRSQQLAVVLYQLWHLCEKPIRAQHVRKLIEDLISNFGLRATCLVVAGTPNDWKSLEQYDLATVVEIGTRHFLDGLAASSTASDTWR